MPANAIAQQIFKTGSLTFFGSSLFFPPFVRGQVSTLYAFVRTADNLVDTTPPLKSEFRRFWHNFIQARKGKLSGNSVIDDFAALEKTASFKPEWMDAFFSSMAQDIHPQPFLTLNDTLAYIYGSANVIGLCMARLLNLPKDSYPYAEKLGEAYQYVNFIRDIAEDNRLGRTYFPQEDLSRFSLSSLQQSECEKRRERFIAFMNFQIDRYLTWQKEAEMGYRTIPKPYLVPIKTATDLYSWTVSQIKKDPFIVFRKKVKPHPAHIIFTGIKNSLIL